jgi:membrane associated rhomboid family serine protease
MLDQLGANLQFFIQQTQLNADILISIVAILWGVFFISLALNHRLLWLGIIPRHLQGLPGIFFSPFLHANFNHLFYNTIPLLVLSDFLLIHGLTYYLIITLSITVISGFLIWLFAKPGIHIGASGVITGYWAVLVSDIYQQGSFMAIALGLTSLYAFAGIFFGIFPKDRGVSWEGHLFGLLAGVLMSFVLK